MSNFINKLTSTDVWAAIYTFILSCLSAVMFYVMNVSDSLLYVIASPALGFIVYVLALLAAENILKTNLSNKQTIYCSILGGILAMIVFGLLIL